MEEGIENVRYRMCNTECVIQNIQYRMWNPESDGECEMTDMK